MRVLIVDDEAVARAVLREHLEEIANVEIVGEAADGLEAVERIHQLRPEVVLLDLQMPELDGFSVARNLAGGRGPLIIFCTAFHQHALSAFEAGAIDYLLKPVRRERLQAALDKARLQLANQSGAQRPRPRKIVGKQGSDMHLLDPAEVVAFHAEGELIFILTSHGKYLATHSLRALEQRVDPGIFRRVHRSTIINTDHIRKISPLSSRRWLLKMSNGMEITVSKRLAGLIRDETR